MKFSSIYIVRGVGRQWIQIHPLPPIEGEGYAIRSENAEDYVKICGWDIKNVPKNGKFETKTWAYRAQIF